MEFFECGHLIVYRVKQKLYGKLPRNYTTKIGTLLFPDVVLDTGYCFQPAAGV